MDKFLEEKTEDGPEFKCELCKDKVYIYDGKDKSVHTCWKCLKECRL
jgi:competence CoiA-like predicted nuclease